MGHPEVRGIRDRMSGEGRSGRGAAGTRADLADAGGRACGCRRVRFCNQSRQVGRYGVESVRHRGSGGGVAGKRWTCGRCGDDGFARCALGHHGGRARGHCAMVSSVTAAACGQARVIAGFKRGREGAEREEQNQKEGEQAPHLGFMVHEFMLSHPCARKKRKEGAPRSGWASESSDGTQVSSGYSV
jgi:hypothetical protein